MSILVTGATGSVGRHVVTALLGAGHQVRAVTRDSTRAGLPAAAEVVTADLGEAATLTQAVFEGVDSVIVFPVEGGVADLVDGALQAGVQHFVVLSSLAAAQEHPRDIGSASAVHHLAVEDAVTSRTEDWAVVRPGTFANNLLSWAHQIRSGLPIRAPYVDSAQAPIHEADVADALVATVTEFDAHRGSKVAITGPQALTRRQQVEVISQAIGRQIALVEISPEQFRQETSAFIPDDITTMLLDYWRDTTTQPDQVRSIEDRYGLHSRTTTEWAQDHRTDFGAPTA